MNRALWHKAILEARLLLLGTVALVFGFMWLFVWISSMIPMNSMLSILLGLAGPLQRMFGIPPAQVATPEGMIALAYVDPIVLLAGAIWGISRGTDVVAGELERGTLELTLAQPVRRLEVLWSHAAVTILGAALIALAAWLGTWVGLNVVDLSARGRPSPSLYVPAALNLFFLTFFVAGASTLVSSLDRYRWRSVGIVGSFYLVQMIMKLTGRMVPDFDGLIRASFLGAYEPQLMVAEPARAWALSLTHDGPLLLLGAAAYAAATFIFTRRDLPAPI